MTELEMIRKVYRDRFGNHVERRARIWSVLVSDFFQKLLKNSDEARVVDLGCGYGEFINHISAAERIAIDVNPDSADFLEKSVAFIPSRAESIATHVKEVDLIFSSNFLEHLPDKERVETVLSACFEALRPGGLLVLLGPNIRYLPGKYWDFWDHYVPLTEKSLRSLLVVKGFQVSTCYARFLPYTMSEAGPPPPVFVKVYLKMKALWPVFGRQFLIIATKPASSEI